MPAKPRHEPNALDDDNDDVVDSDEEPTDVGSEPDDDDDKDDEAAANDDENFDRDGRIEGMSSPVLSPAPRDAEPPANTTTMIDAMAVAALAPGEPAAAAADDDDVVFRLTRVPFDAIAAADDQVDAPIDYFTGDLAGRTAASIIDANDRARLRTLHDRMERRVEQATAALHKTTMRLGDAERERAQLRRVHLFHDVEVGRYARQVRALQARLVKLERMAKLTDAKVEYWRGQYDEASDRRQQAEQALALETARSSRRRLANQRLAKDVVAARDAIRQRNQAARLLQRKAAAAATTAAMRRRPGGGRTARV